MVSLKEKTHDNLVLPIDNLCSKMIDFTVQRIKNNVLTSQRQAKLEKVKDTKPLIKDNSYTEKFMKLLDYLRIEIHSDGDNA